MDRHKKIINQINVVPYIDVLLVLMVILMISTPLFTPSVINLPRASNITNKVRTKPIEISVGYNNYILKYKQRNFTRSSLPSIMLQLQKITQNNPETPVLISASKNIDYSSVVHVINALYKLNIKNMSLVVRQG